MTTLREELKGLEPEFVGALPPQIPVDQFCRILMTAVQMRPELEQADRKSFITACMNAARDGLLLDGREAVINVYNSKDKATGSWRKVAQYLPMVAGIRKKVRQSGEVADLRARVVYEHDEFVYEMGDIETIIHRPKLDGERGRIIGAYSIADLKDGTKSREFMTIAEVEAVRSRSKAENGGPWFTDYGEMVRKTVIKRHSKALPMSTDALEAIGRIDELYDYEPQPQIEGRQQPRLARSRLKGLIGQKPAESDVPRLTVDRETGEIIEGDVDDQPPPKPEPKPKDKAKAKDKDKTEAKTEPKPKDKAEPEAQGDPDADLILAISEASDTVELNKYMTGIAKIPGGDRKMRAIAAFEAARIRIGGPSEEAD
jgi:recombination protein RecT